MKLLSYNIQAAIASDSYWSYLSRLHRQILPSREKEHNLKQIADYISEFDIVCLQEIDLGGLRNNFKNQMNQLLELTPFQSHNTLWQINRTVGKLSVHGNLILSKMPIREVINQRLPSRIKGRGMLAGAVQTPMGELVIANVHLSLGLLDQFKQIRFIREQLKRYENVCLMGDFNCPPNCEQLHLLTDFDYIHLNNINNINSNTYPSWNPKQTLDHIFIKGLIQNNHINIKVSDFTASDHLPVILEILF